jgi:arabinogalactan endo-1,4-beta-galactosidase
VLHRLIAFFVALSATTVLAQPATQPARPFYRGVDISMLPEIEKAGGIFRNDAGEPADAIKIFRDHGVNMFRVRLFVDPSKDFNKVWGATQDLPMVRTLSKRIKDAGGLLLLDLHYSDTWADGMKQAKPRAWEGKSFDELERAMHDYTAEVLADLKVAGATPDMVAVGNEIAGGIVFPDGQVLDAKSEDAPKQWANFSKLLNAGVRAVREASTPDHKIEVMIHIHGGGRPGLPKWFFGKLQQNPVDFDVIGLSVYPAWGDSFPAFADNMKELSTLYGKPVIAAETGYPWKPEEDVKDQKLMPWPQTVEGQQTFVRDLTKLLYAAPPGTGAGFIWWYPEAIPSKGLYLWRAGAEALFDPTGKPLPALGEFAESR